MERLISNLKAGEFRYETHEERSHLVVPVVLLTEGVHNGSGGPLYYPKEEIQRFAHAWNGMPVPVFHPERNGQPCTCNEPEILERYNVGRLFNVQFTDNKLKGEIWVDVQKAERVHPGLIDLLKDSGAKLEVSTGLTSMHDEVEGTWNNENYVAVVRDIHPDHLALLPGTKGACSWEDGCGIRVNKGEKMEKQHPILLNESSMNEKLDSLIAKINSMDNESYWYFLEAAYDGYLIYRKSSRQDTNESDGFYKVNYSIGNNNEVSFIGDPIKVKKEISYTTINKEDTMSKKEDKKEKETQNKAPCDACVELVNALISNEYTHWNEDDRSFLEEMDKSSLEKMVPVVPEPTQNEEQKIIETNEEEEQKPMTTEEYIANAPASMQEVLREGMQTLQEKKNKLVDSILANKRNTFTKEQLKDRSTDELQAIANLAVTPKYESGAPVITDNAEDEELLEIPTLIFDKK